MSRKIERSRVITLRSVPGISDEEDKPLVQLVKIKRIHSDLPSSNIKCDVLSMLFHSIVEGLF